MKLVIKVIFKNILLWSHWKIVNQNNGFLLYSCFRAVKNLEDVLDRIDVQVTVTNLTIGNSVVLLFKPNGTFDGLQIFASDSQVLKRAHI